MTGRAFYEQLAVRDGGRFLAAIGALPEYKPRSGVTLARLRVTVEVVDGPSLGSVVKDSVNVHDLADLIAARAEGLHAKFAATQSARPELHLVAGDR